VQQLLLRGDNRNLLVKVVQQSVVIGRTLLGLGSPSIRSSFLKIGLSSGIHTPDCARIVLWHASNPLPFSASRLTIFATANGSLNVFSSSR